MNDIIKDFHELTEIPVFQEMVPDKKYMGYRRASGCIADEYRTEM